MNINNAVLIVIDKWKCRVNKSENFPLWEPCKANSVTFFLRAFVWPSRHSPVGASLPISAASHGFCERWQHTFFKPRLGKQPQGLQKPPRSFASAWECLPIFPPTLSASSPTHTHARAHTQTQHFVCRTISRREEGSTQLPSHAPECNPNLKLGQHR